VAAASAAASVPAATHYRPETVAETSPGRPPAPTAPRAATVLEPRPRESAKPQNVSRPATLLAPQNPGQTAGSTLAVASGPYAGQRFAISSNEFWIGSGPNNHLCLSADSAVSGNHACIRREEGFLRLYDNGSLNNTIVNGRAIGREVVLLRVGDRIRIGQSELNLES
jgi:pSer/pThr/pTyr-binding forkhead associated (FHA) protein